MRPARQRFQSTQAMCWSEGWFTSQRQSCFALQRKWELFLLAFFVLTCEQWAKPSPTYCQHACTSSLYIRLAARVDVPALSLNVVLSEMAAASARLEATQHHQHFRLCIGGKSGPAGLCHEAPLWWRLTRGERGSGRKPPSHHHGSRLRACTFFVGGCEPLSPTFLLRRHAITASSGSDAQASHGLTMNVTLTRSIVIL